jgi:hypothetical protein
MRTTMYQGIDTLEAPWQWSCWQFSALCQLKFPFNRLSLLSFRSGSFTHSQESKWWRTADFGWRRLRGWWNLGRATTLSPLETAKAFGAPLLAKWNSNDTVENLVHNVKHQIVKYGATLGDELGDRGSRLGLEEYGEVHTPRSETIFQQW